MPIVPSQLLQFADFRNSQGFASMYDMKIINRLLLAKIEVKDGDRAALYRELMPALETSDSEGYAEI